MLKYISLLLFFCSLLSHVKLDDEIKIDETVFEGIVNSYQIRDYEREVGHLENTTDLTYLVYYYRKSSDNSKFGGYYLQRVDKKLEYLAMILLVDCDLVIPRNVSHCQVKRTDIDPFPKIKLLVPPMYKFDPKTKKMNSHIEIDYSEDMVSEDNFYKFITQNIPSYSTKLTKENVEIFVGQPMFNKLILFTDKPNTPLTYKGLSNLYYDRILFGEIHSENKEFVQKFNITKFPSILAMENPFMLKEEYKIHVYNGTNSAAEISVFIEQYALREKNYVKRLAESKIEKTAFPVITNENFEDFFEADKNISKIVYFTKGSLEVPEDVKRFAAITSGYFLYAVFNCENFELLCKSEFYVDTELLPSLYLFQNSTDYSEMMKKNILLPVSFNKLLNYFVQRVKSNVTKAINDDVYNYINLDRDAGRYPVVYVHKNETKVNLPLHLIASLPEYASKISFYELNDPSKDLLEVMKIHYKEALTLLFLHDSLSIDNFRLLRFEDNFKSSFLSLKTFLDNVIGDYTLPIKSNDFKQRKEWASKSKFERLEERIKFFRKCIYGNQYCVFALLDGDYDEELKRINLSFNKNLKIIESIPQDSQASAYINHFYYVNATCYNEFSANFKVRLSKLPTVVLYDPFNKMYAKMKADEPFEKANILNFLTEAIERKIFFRKIDESEADFKEKYCLDKKTKSKDVDFDKLDRIRQGLEDDDEEEVENKIRLDL